MVEYDCIVSVFVYLCSRTVVCSLPRVAKYFCERLAVSFLFIVHYFSSVCLCHCSLNICKDIQFCKWQETPVFID